MGSLENMQSTLLFTQPKYYSAVPIERSIKGVVTSAQPCPCGKLGETDSSYQYGISLMGEIPPHCHLRSQEGIRSPLLGEQIDKDLKEDGKRSNVMLLTIVIYNVQGG